MCANWVQSCPTLCDPMDYIACQAPLSMEILQERMLRWVAMPSSRRSSWPRGSTLYSLCNVLIFLCLWKFSLLSTLLYLILTYAFILLFSKLSMPLLSFLGFPGGSDSKDSTCLVKTWIQPLGWEDTQEEDMGIHVLAWRIPWTEKPGGLYSMGHTESGTA